MDETIILSLKKSVGSHKNFNVRTSKHAVSGDYEGQTDSRGRPHGHGKLTLEDGSLIRQGFVESTSLYHHDLKINMS